MDIYTEQLKDNMYKVTINNVVSILPADYPIFVNRVGQLIGTDIESLMLGDEYYHMDKMK